MPTQRSLFNGEILITVPDSILECVGGCGIESDSLYHTPVGGMCVKCINDLYVSCEDCGKMLRYDEWGECDDLRTGDDNKHRCVACDAALFSVCVSCSCCSFRAGNDIRTDPDDPTKEFCQSCWDNYWFICDACGGVFPFREYYTAPNHSAHYCEQCFEQDYFRCSGCAGSFNRANIHGWDGDPFCNECFGRADIWKVQPWSGNAVTFNSVGSERCFGVELETESCDNYQSLHGQTEWGCVYECSTLGREFVSPILQGDEGFQEIRILCDIADKYDWSVGQSCGLHIHLDARDLSSSEVLQVAYAYRKTYPLWKKFVNRRRGENSMCGSPQYSATDIRAMEHAEDFAESCDRFEFVNWRAYLAHGSIEIRIYQGSLNSREICNWIALHTRFVDVVKSLTFNEIDSVLGRITRTNWRGLTGIIDDTNLLDYWRRVANRRGNSLPALWADATEDDVPEGERGEDDARRVGIGVAAFSP
jgi:Putative amidoligase enzyme